MDDQSGFNEEADRHLQLRVLLIEDSDTDAYLVERALRRHMNTAEIQRVMTLGEGEEVLQKGAADLLLLDLGLPDTNDPEDTYRRIKKWTEKFPVVIMTNLKDHNLAREMVRDGAADFVNKDSLGKDPEIIRTAIDFSLDRHAARQRLVSEKEKAQGESKEKDAILSCFMGGYSITDRDKSH